MTETAPPHASWAHQSDPLFAFLSKFRIASTFRFSITYTTAWIVSHGIFFGAVSWLNPQSIESVYKDYSEPSSVIYIFVVVPLLAGFYGWINVSAEKLLTSLRDADIWKNKSDLAAVSESFDSNNGSIGKVQCSKWFSLAAVVIPLLATCAELAYIGLEGRSLLSPVKAAPQQVFWIGFVCFSPIVLIGWYFALMTVFRSVLVIVSLELLFQGRHLRLHPLHPDRCGGLGLINAYALRVTYFIAVGGIGLMLVALNLYNSCQLAANPIVIPAIIGYCVITPLLFFMTLAPAHNQMLEAKQRFLKDISDQFLGGLEQVQTALSAATQDLKLHIEKIEQLQGLYKVAKSFPVWPFDATSLRRFSAAFVSPALTIVFSALLPKLVNWIWVVSG